MRPRELITAASLALALAAADALRAEPTKAAEAGQNLARSAREASHHRPAMAPDPGGFASRPIELTRDGQRAFDPARLDLEFREHRSVRPRPEFNVSSTAAVEPRYVSSGAAVNVGVRWPF